MNVHKPVYTDNFSTTIKRRYLKNKDVVGPPIPTFCQYSFKLPVKEAVMTGVWLYSLNFLVLVRMFLPCLSKFRALRLWTPTSLVGQVGFEPTQP
jgi:hypothetical protein